MKKMLLLLLVLLMGCQTNKVEYKRYLRGTVNAGFDTYVEMLAYTESEEEFNKHFQSMEEQLFAYNQIFDNYKTYDNQLSLMEVNKKAGQGPIKVSSDLIKVLSFSKAMYDQGYTKFNPTMGAVLKIWHDYRTDGILANQNGQPGKTPSLQELKQADQCTGWDKLIIDEDNSTIEITDACTQIDLGGIAKGYAAEQVALNLEQAGLKYGILNPGGNIRTINTRADGNPWNIAVQKPTLLKDDGNIDVISFKESMAMVTSGDYQRAYENEEGLRIHHLIDPDSLMPPHYFRSVTIMTKSSTVADFFSTVLYLTNYEDGKKLIERYNQQNPQAPLYALWVIDGESSTESSDFFEVDEKPFKVAITDNLKKHSKQYQKHH